MCTQSFEISRQRFADPNQLHTIRRQPRTNLDQDLCKAALIAARIVSAVTTIFGIIGLIATGAPEYFVLTVSGAIITTLLSAFKAERDERLARMRSISPIPTPKIADSATRVDTVSRESATEPTPASITVASRAVQKIEAPMREARPADVAAPQALPFEDRADKVALLGNPLEKLAPIPLTRQAVRSEDALKEASDAALVEAALLPPHEARVEEKAEAPQPEKVKENEEKKSARGVRPVSFRKKAQAAPAATVKNRRQRTRGVAIDQAPSRRPAKIIKESSSSSEE